MGGRSHQDRTVGSSPSFIDFWARPPIPAFLAQASFAKVEALRRIADATGLGLAASARDRSLANCLEEMAAAGIGRAVVPALRRRASDTGHNDELAAFVRAHPDAFFALAAPNIADAGNLAEETASLAARPEFSGVVLEPGLWEVPLRLNDPALMALYACCEERDIPVVVVGGGNAGPDLSFTSPLLLDEVASNFPRLTLVVVHGGWPWVTETLHVAFRRENVYVAPDMYLYGFPGWRDYSDAANGMLRDRFVFASGYPFVPFASAVARARELFRPEVFPQVMRENAIRVLSKRRPAAPRSKGRATQ